MNQEPKHLRTMTVYLAGKSTDERGITTFYAEIVGGGRDGRRITIVDKPWNCPHPECPNHEEKPE